MTFLAAAVCAAQTVEQPSRTVTDPGIITTRQAITPAGVPRYFRGGSTAWRGPAIAANCGCCTPAEVYRLDWKNNRVVARSSARRHSGQSVDRGRSGNGRRGIRPIGSATSRQSAQPRPASRWRTADSLRLWRGVSDGFLPGALSYRAGGRPDGRRYVAVPLVWENKLALVDAGQR